VSQGPPWQIDLRQSVQHWPLKTKVKRAAWELTQFFLFRPTPKRLGNPWRVWLLKRFGAQIRGPVLIHQSCRILQPWHLDMGEFSAVASNVNIYNFAPVVIGPMSVVSQGVYLCTGSHDYTHPHMPLTWAPITIGSECWVAADAFVSPGVHIGNGTVVGARSVVTKSLPEWTVCAGNPCKPIKPRLINPI